MRISNYNPFIHFALLFIDSDTFLINWSCIRYFFKGYRIFIVYFLLYLLSWLLRKYYCFWCNFRKSFIRSFQFIIFYYFLKSSPWFFYVNLKIKLVILWKESLQLMSDFFLFFKTLNKLRNIYYVLSHFIVLLIFILNQFKSKLLFSKPVIVGNIKVQLTSRNS